MAFRVGQKVVCVNDKVDPGRSWVFWGPPVKGLIYTVAGYAKPADYHSELVIRLVEIDGKYRVSRFRPVVERKTDISIFTAMLNPSREKVRA